MPADLLTEASWLVPTTAVAAAMLSSIIRPLVSLLKMMVRERSRTTRFDMALKDSTPDERGEIIRACGQLEANCPHEPTIEEPETAPPTQSARLPLLNRLLQSARETDPRKD
ncbi:hypothetical protein [Umezawaea sp. Da 62-37]|uniref:hypothetical protein n=1 Tax=Umezawaea sp. Da 62-37 TaxID=3075927 RepID=UPI0028F6F994|nr:hypothetical protein [Umezawaea sp. Da 62-37]WNV86455.1 hypothetical protein RM788_51485 [Umezawaea sp. Da 62-37]